MSAFAHIFLVLPLCRSVVHNLFGNLSSSTRCPISDESHLFPLSSHSRSPPSGEIATNTAISGGETVTTVISGGETVVTVSSGGETVVTASSGHPSSSSAQQTATPSGNDDIVVVDSEGKVNAAWKGLSSKPTTQSIFRTLTERSTLHCSWSPCPFPSGDGGEQ